MTDWSLMKVYERSSKRANQPKITVQFYLGQILRSRRFCCSDIQYKTNSGSLLLTKAACI